MESLRFLVFGILLGLVQGSLEKSWGFAGPAPDFLLIYIVWLGISGRTGIALWVAFLGGLVQDSVTEMDLMGIHSLGRTAIAYLPEWGRLVLVSESRFSGVLLVAAATLLQSMIVLSILQTLVPETVWSSAVLYHWGFSIILNGATWMILGFLIAPREKPEFAT